MNSTTAVPISAFQETLGMIYFARMLDKIRKHQAGCLRADFIDNLGGGFDGRCCDFLRVAYSDLRERTLGGGTNEEILQWCFAKGRQLSEGDIHIWNEYLLKRGIDDPVTEILARRKMESGLADRDEIRTMLQYFEYDEGRAG